MKKILILLLIPLAISSSDLDYKYQKQKIKNEKAARKLAQKALKAAQKQETFGFGQRQIRETHQGVSSVIQIGEVSTNSVLKQTAESTGALYKVFTRENMAFVRDTTVAGISLIKVSEVAVGNTIALTAANVEVASYGLTHGLIMGAGDAVGTQVTTASAATATALAPYLPVIAGVAITGGVAYGGYKTYRHLNPTEAMKLEEQRKLDAMKADIAKSKEQIALSETNIVSFHVQAESFKAQAENFKAQAEAIKLESQPVKMKLEELNTESELRRCFNKNFCSQKLNAEGFASECDSPVRRLRSLTLNPNAGSGLINIFRRSYPQQ